MTKLAKLCLTFLCLLAAGWSMAQLPPLYIVNGEQVSDIDSIPPEVIERVEVLPADEETIARYGEGAQNGVMLVTLKYDRAARFLDDTVSFDRYIARRVVWGRDEPAARVVLRYTVQPDGRV